jgi:hypothetical protein
LGLWTYRDIHFSRYGTLLDTAAALVPQSPAGYFVDELEVRVQVAAKDTLRQLAQAGRLYRSPWEGRYLYCALDRARRQEQWDARRTQQHSGDDLQAARALFYSLLDELASPGRTPVRSAPRVAERAPGVAEQGL